MSTSDRLYPSRYHSRRYILTLIREEIEAISVKYLGKDDTLIDFGCDTMPYKPILEPYIKQYIGVDLSSNQQADKYLTIEHNIPVQDNFCECMLSTQVLEHVPVPQNYLCEAHRVLKSQGLLILSTHGYWVYHPHPTDYWRWTSEGLRNLITEAGFQIVHFKGLMSVAAAGMQLYQDTYLLRQNKWLRPFFTFLMQRKIQKIDNWTVQNQKDMDAGVYFIVAKKV